MTTHALHARNTARLTSSRRAGSRWGQRRAGYTSIGTVMFILIGITTLMLVVNWTYLVLVNRHTLRLADTLALSAVSELLDENVLLDQAFDASDDITAAGEAIVSPMTGFLAMNNAGVGAPLRAAPTDLTITAGRVEYADEPLGPASFDPMPALNEPYNTLRVEVLRSANGLNPVELMIRGFGSPNAAKISAAAYATLDSRVVGFRPKLDVPSPVAPLAISEDAWFNERVNGGLDSNGNGRLELDIVLKPTPGSMLPANGALVGLDSSAALDTNLIPSQVRDGIVPGYLDSSGMLGPATTDDSLSLDAQFDTPSNVVAIVDAFEEVAASNDCRRIFPIFSSVSDPASVIGFVCGRVLAAEAMSTSDGTQLRVRVEPEFIVHSTVVTTRVDSTSTVVPENLYIHKIRRTR